MPSEGMESATRISAPNKRSETRSRSLGILVCCSVRYKIYERLQACYLAPQMAYGHIFTATCLEASGQSSRGASGIR